MNAQTPAGATDVAGWLKVLAERGSLTKKTQKVADCLAAFPRLASYGSVREVSEKASVSIGTVTRTAQALGFSGWPALQEELRTIYIASLSASEIIEHRKDEVGRPAYIWLTRDRDNLNAFIKSVEVDQITRIARAIARSRRAFVIAIGSYNGIGHVLSHSVWLHGYDMRLLTDEAQIINTVSQANIDDLVVTIGFWRLYETIYQVVQTCHDNGVPVIMMTEGVTHDIEKKCLECIRIPAEVTGFQPSMTVVTSVVHAIVAELTALDPERAARALKRSEDRWAQFQLLHPY